MLCIGGMSTSDCFVCKCADTIARPPVECAMYTPQRRELGEALLHLGKRPVTWFKILSAWPERDASFKATRALVKYFVNMVF